MLRRLLAFAPAGAALVLILLSHGAAQHTLAFGHWFSTSSSFTGLPFEG